jgi:hypothetical protein
MAEVVCLVFPLLIKGWWHTEPLYNSIACLTNSMKNIEYLSFP